MKTDRLGSLQVMERTRAWEADERHDSFVISWVKAEIKEWCEDVLGFEARNIFTPRPDFRFWTIPTDLSVSLVPVFRDRKVVGVRLLVPCWGCEARELMDPVAKDLAGLVIMLEDQALRKGENLTHAYGLDGPTNGSQVYWQIKRRHGEDCEAAALLDI
jgi:hypothetical protein